MSLEVKILGLSAERGRWLLVLLGMSVLLCLGSVYAWSVFRKPLESEFNIGATESLLPYTIALVFYAALMPISGFLIPRMGPQMVTTIGGLAVGLGYVLSSFASDITAMTLTYGVIAGTGVGIAYGVPMAVVAQWFPDKKGLAVGITIVGFGLSPLISAPIASSLMSAYSLRIALRVLGVAFGLLIPAIATTLRFPPKDWHPSQASALAPLATQDRIYPKHLLTSRSFYGLWICYALGTLIGLSAIGISSPVGEEMININPGLAASSVSLFAVFNGVARPLFGWLSDRFEPHYVAIASYALILVACILMVSAQPGQVTTYLLAFCLFWFCLGGWLAIAPTTTLRFFDPNHYAQNYGIVFTAYGIGALSGTLVTGRIRDWLGSYTYVFYLMALLSLIGIVTASTLLKRDKSNLIDLS
ncbi:transporter, major facilitator family [Synechococcus sp. PCC 7335]|uniref:L-lactate MFS transporter n=1 Tax=Synechococcus sp. (strain ATCC 29403 / PCC 7335) TaxID=91464 RepID=UPI00017ECB36|nr:OFA family MFS transporter [Synechococcus sp. PCC 7335]EDX84628.1 transporter, major facilitator family [Synechococcus sp. PCC 7335]